MAGVIEENAVVFRDLVRQIGKEGDIERTQAPVLPGSLDPSQVSELRVDGYTNYFCVDSPELLSAIAGYEI